MNSLKPASLALLLFLNACSVSEPVPRAQVIKFSKARPVESLPKLVGIVSMVNSEDGFVLIETNYSAPLDAGTALKCFRDGAETGILAVGKERRRPYVTADIVSGEPQRGDQVFE